MKIGDLNREYMQCEARINRLENMLSKKVSYYFASAWPEGDTGDNIDEDEWSTPDQQKRFKVFIRSEMQVEIQHLHDIAIKMARVLLGEYKS